MLSRFWLGITLAVSASSVTAQEHPRFHTLLANRRNRYDLRMTYPQWRPKTPVLRAANWSYRQRTYANWFRIRKIARQQFADAPRGWKPAAGPNYFHWTPQLSIQSPELISGYYFADYFDGGFHPNTETVPLNIGMVRGKAKLLSIYDLCLPQKTGAVATKVFQRLRRIPQADWAHPTMQSLTEKSVVLTKTFVITPMGLLFIFDPYVAGSYASGEIRVKISFSALKDELDPNGPLQSLL